MSELRSQANPKELTAEFFDDYGFQMTPPATNAEKTLLAAGQLLLSARRVVVSANSLKLTEIVYEAAYRLCEAEGSTRLLRSQDG